MISFSHFRQFCTYSWLPRLRLLRTDRTAGQNQARRTGSPEQTLGHEEPSCQRDEQRYSLLQHLLPTAHLEQVTGEVHLVQVIVDPAEGLADQQLHRRTH